MGNKKRRNDKTEIEVSPQISPTFAPKMSQEFSPANILAPTYITQVVLDPDVIAAKVVDLLGQKEAAKVATTVQLSLEDFERRIEEAKREAYDRGKQDSEEQYRHEIESLKAQIKDKQVEPPQGAPRIRAAIRLYNFAVDLSNADQVKEAIALLTVAIDQNPNLKAAYINRAYLRGRAHDYAGAIEDWTKCIEFDPKNANLIHNRAAAKNMISDFAGAEQDVRQAIHLDPSVPSAYRTLGNALLGQGRLDAALSAFNKRIRLSLREADGYISRGGIFHRLGRNEEALADYARAIEFAPNNPIVYNNRAVIEANLRQFDAALADYGRALDVRPDYTEARKNLAHMLLALGRNEDALMEWEDLITRRPNRVGWFVGRARAKFKLDDKEGAFADFRKALELDPDSSEAHYRLAATLAEEGRKDEAEVNLLRAIELDTRHIELAGRDKAFLSLRDSSVFQGVVPRELWVKSDETEENPTYTGWSFVDDD